MKGECVLGLKWRKSTRCTEPGCFAACMYYLQSEEGINLLLTWKLFPQRGTSRWPYLRLAGPDARVNRCCIKYV